MEIKIEAARRLAAMSITKGDNFKQGLHTAKALMDDPAGDFKVLQSHGRQVLLKLKSSYAEWYCLATCEDEASVKGLPRELRVYKDSPLYETSVQSIDALISVEREGEVNSVWVSKDLREQGFGKALYKIAHHYSKHGIRSSTNMGTMSLAVWLALGKQHPEIFLKIKGYGNAGLDDVEINGLEITMDAEDLNLTSSNGPDFQFVWPK